MPPNRTVDSTSKNRRGRGPGTPLYMQVVNELKAEIVRGVHPVGTQLPSESALVDRFQVSRQTVRLALRTLREAGLVKSHQGLGTIVERPGLNYGYVHQVNTISDLFPTDVDTHYMPPDAGLAPLPAKARVFPDLDTEGKWLEIKAKRYRQGDNRPFNIMCAYVDEGFSGIGRIIADYRGSIYALIETMFGETIDEVEQVITTFAADRETADELGMGIGDIGVEVRRKYLISSSNQTALVSINRYAPDKFSFSMKLRKVRG